MNLIEKVRTENPLVHNITNQVVSNDVANALLAIGASPMMAYAPEEMKEVAATANAVVLNAGTLTKDILASMILVGSAANKLGKPVVLDPVGVGATQFRRKSMEHLLTKVHVDLIRGNAGEMATLAGIPWNSKGVDGGQGTASVKEIAQIVANKYQTVVALSGEEDIISDGIRTVIIRNGHPLMSRVTGTGCMLSGICGAFLAVGPTDIFNSTVTACTVFAIAGEQAAESQNLEGPGYFRPAFMDCLYHLNTDVVENHKKIQEVKINE